MKTSWMIFSQALFTVHIDSKQLYTENHDVNVNEILICSCYTVAFIRLELDDNIVTFCDDINNQAVEICSIVHEVYSCKAIYTI